MADLRSYQRQVVTDLCEQGTTRNEIEQSLVKWADHYDGVYGEEEYAIKKSGSFRSMASITSVIAEIEQQLREDARIPSPARNGNKRKA
jgi:hypothetical protein